ncbi:MerR family transcriptional regulator [bacterium]|nr:MerR family transcriptional regulator [bacterium]
MKISELSQRSGVPLATLKFYLREGVLMPGIPTGPNQATYTDEHLRRLALIHALKEAGHLSIGGIRKVTALVDQPDAPVWDVLGVAVDALSEREAAIEPADAARLSAEADVDRLLAGFGWQTRPEAAAKQDLVDALLAMRRLLSPNLPVETLLPYAQAVEALASQEVAYTAEAVRSDATRAIEEVVLGTMLFEPAIIALRRLAHEHLANPTRQAEGAPKPETCCDRPGMGQLTPEPPSKTDRK